MVRHDCAVVRRQILVNRVTRPSSGRVADSKGPPPWVWPLSAIAIQAALVPRRGVPELSHKPPLSRLVETVAELGS